MPWRRHRSSGFAPASCSFSTPMICSSVNRLFLIVDLLRSTQLSAGRNSGEQVSGSLSSGPAHDFPFCVPVGSQAPHAAGVAYAFKFRKEPRVAVCLLGDGATSKGDVWEAMNFAGVWKLPVVFVANNNQWAISVPLKLQTASETLAQKAIAAGFTGEQVDGNDVIAVRAAAEEAIAAARSGEGPRL